MSAREQAEEYTQALGQLATLAGPPANHQESSAHGPAPAARPEERVTVTAPKLITAAGLMNLSFPEARWAVPGLLPEGCTLLAGKPKIGKSWLALGIALAIAAGGRALGQIAVQRGDVLYLALEDTSKRLQTRLASMLGNETAPERLQLAVSWPRLDQGGSVHLEAWLSSHRHARLVIVDTLARIRGGRARNGNLYDEDYQAVAWLKRLADNAGCAMLVVHHVRKSGAEDPFDTVSGTNAITGAADSIALLGRDRASRDAKLVITGRDLEDQELGLRWDSTLTAWTLQGSNLSEERRALLDVVEKSLDPISLADLAAGLGKEYNAVKILAWRMAQEGQLKSDQGRYYLPTGNRGN